MFFVVNRDQFSPTEQIFGKKEHPIASVKVALSEGAIRCAENRLWALGCTKVTCRPRISNIRQVVFVPFVVFSKFQVVSIVAVASPHGGQICERAPTTGKRMYRGERGRQVRCSQIARTRESSFMDGVSEMTASLNS